MELNFAVLFFKERYFFVLPGDAHQHAPG